MSNDSASERALEDQKRSEAERTARIADGKARIEKAFSGFNDEFYQKLREAQLGTLVPDIGKQYNDARAALTYALARGGVLDSDVAGRRAAELAGDRETALSEADSVANTAVNDARTALENERQILTAQLQSTADPELAAEGAAARATVLKNTSPILSLGPLFQNATAGLAAATAPKYDSYGVKIDRTGGLFSRAGDRSRVVTG